MGLEAECTVRVGRRTSEGTALLESDVVVFRGGLALRIPFDGIKDLRVEGDDLVIVEGAQEARLTLGAPVAERWFRLIKEPKSLFEKLELGPESRVAVVDVRDSLFLTALRERIASVAEGRVPEGARVVFFGCETRDALRKVQLLRARMVDDGVLWIVRPKGSAAIAESDVFETIRANGLVDTKVVAFSKTHTAHKCVIPVELRGQVRRLAPIVSLPPPPPGSSPKKLVLKAPSPAKKAPAPAKAKPEPKAATRPAPKAKPAARPAPRPAKKPAPKAKAGPAKKTKKR